MSTFQVAVLTISDTASKDPSADESGPSIIDALKARQEFQVKLTTLPSDLPRSQYYQIVADDIDQIQATIKQWTDGEEAVDWVITTGGTGFGVRDVTPEAIKPILDREASGIVHLLLSSSLKHTPFAALSRPIAGTRKNTLIVTLPGSVKAVKENLEALFSGNIINHALDLIKGGTGRNVHATLSTKTLISSQPSVHHSHDHHHHHHDHDHKAPVPRTAVSYDPSAPVSTRHRQSPYPLISFEAAIGLITTNVKRLPVQTLPVNSQLRNHVLAEDIYAPQQTPPRATTSVDGYALRSTDLPGVYKVLTARNHAIDTPLPEGYIYRINTGGPLPTGADSIIMVEDTKLVSTHEAAEGNEEGEEKEVETLAQVSLGENVRAPGTDVRKGDLVLQQGERIHGNGGEIGTLAFVGRKDVSVYKKPIAAILSTGNEIMDLHDATTTTEGNEWGGIFDTNRPSLQAALESMGYSVVDLGIVRDNVDAHVNALRKGVETADIIITTGGTSMGPTDLLKPVIERHLNGTIHFGRVTIKPGKPTTFATIPTDQGQEKPLFALPGNPASALVTFHIFVIPALRKLAGWPNHLLQLPRVAVELGSAMSLDHRMEFHRVIVRSENDGLKAYSTGGQRSSRIASLSGANGFVVLPIAKADAPLRLDAGTKVEAVMIGAIQVIQCDQ